MKPKKQLSLFIFLLALNLSVTYFLHGLGVKGLCNDFGAWGVVRGDFTLIAGNFVFLLLVLKLLSSTSEKFLQLALIVILAGGIANFIERVVNGCVFDYFNFIPFWPMFNLADVMVVGGIGVYILVKAK